VGVIGIGRITDAGYFRALGGIIKSSVNPVIAGD
jgi:hypothetical protein